MAPPLDLSPLERPCYGYLRWPLPCERDDEIAAILPVLPHYARELTDRHAGVLSGFAERMASLAVRRHSRQLISDGLIANAVALCASKDFRDVLSPFAALYRAAERIGQAPGEVFFDAARRLPTDIGKHLISFAGRTPQNRSLQAFFYVEKHDPDGFWFEQKWPI